MAVRSDPHDRPTEYHAAWMQRSYYQQLPLAPLSTEAIEALLRDLAARMEQIAEPGRIYLAEATAQICQGFFALRDLGRHEVRGLSQPVGVFDLKGVGRMRTRLDVSHARGFSRFVGRQSEMAALEAALETRTTAT
jgi:hypothetical protein